MVPKTKYLFIGIAEKTLSKYFVVKPFSGSASKESARNAGRHRFDPSGWEDLEGKWQYPVFYKSQDRGLERIQKSTESQKVEMT